MENTVSYLLALLRSEGTGPIINNGNATVDKAVWLCGQQKMTHTYTTPYFLIQVIGTDFMKSGHHTRSQ